MVTGPPTHPPTNTHTQPQTERPSTIHCAAAGAQCNHPAQLCNNNEVMFTGRIAAKRQTAGIKFLSQVENQHFRPAGATRCTDSCEIWRSRRARGSAWSCKISRQSVNGSPHERGPQNGKIFHFLVKSRPAEANPLTDIYSCYGLLYAQLPCISVLHLR